MSLSSCCKCTRGHFELERCWAWACRFHPHERRSLKVLQVALLPALLLHDLSLAAPNDHEQNHHCQCSCYQPNQRNAIHLRLLFVLIFGLANFTRSLLPTSLVEGR